MTNRSAPRLAVTGSRVRPDIADPLLTYIRQQLASTSVEYAQEPSPILGGFDTAIYGFRLSGVPAPYSQAMIVRVFRSQEDAVRASYESLVQSAVHALGYPAPRVYFTETGTDALDSPFTIMQRMPGRVMLDSLLGTRMMSMPAVLGRAQAQLHSLDASEFRRQLGDARDPRGLDTIENILRRFDKTIVSSSLDGLRPALEWLAVHRPPTPTREAICHGDFHPLNVLVTKNEVTGVVDWAWAMIADPAYDVGASVALFSQGPVNLPRPIRPVAGVVRQWMVRRYLRAYAARRALDLDAVRYFEALRLLGFLMEVGEQLQPAARLVQSDWESAFIDPVVRESIIRRLRKITGVRAALPTQLEST